ncbi:MAG: hypothetical protein JJU30_05990 [Alkalimonas sp.]|nr:hypothetical protein [Alkalimonas sp.]
MHNTNSDEKQLVAQQKAAELESLYQQDKLAELNKEFEALRPKAWRAWSDFLLAAVWIGMLVWLAPDFYDQPGAGLLVAFIASTMMLIGRESQRIHKRIDLLKAMLQK